MYYGLYFDSMPNPASFILLPLGVMDVGLLREILLLKMRDIYWKNLLKIIDSIQMNLFFYTLAKEYEFLNIDAGLIAETYLKHFGKVLINTIFIILIKIVQAHYIN